jgi:DNA mismatch repair protein MutL
MQQIKILPAHLRNKIAAGEVIERPASVVKELIENSIDAGATEIKVDILYGGKRLMRVSDNGVGMSREDALLCFERYATSKLHKEEDLFNIRTMGFRGEALSSIASVSKLRLVTGLKNSPPQPPVSKGGTRGGVGVSVELYGGEVREVRDSPSIGTSIEVRDLFFNTPARKKFLKTNSTELFHIIDIVTKETLSHPKIGFRLISDNHETMNLPLSSGTKERLMQVYGEEFLSGLGEIQNKTEGITLHAYVSKSDNFRKAKSHQFIFINNRPVKDQSISSAIYRGFEGILPREKHPVFFIFLDIDPVKIDVNVHPTKREVRFEDKESVYRFVLASIREMIKKERKEFTESFMTSPVSNIHTSAAQFQDRPHSINLQAESEISAISENFELTYRPQLPHLYLGETFVAVAGKGGLTLIDHHAAHERILYERFLQGINLNSTRLLFPRQIKLSPKEYQVILENMPAFRDFGIEIDDFGYNTVIVRSLPDALKNADIGGILSDVASCILEGTAPDKSEKESLAARIACHSSVRGKEIMTHEEVSKLITDLEQTENPDQCPHGRPTRIFLSLDDLKKMFKRK